MHEIRAKALPEMDIHSVDRITDPDQILSGYSSYLSDESKLTSATCDALYLPKTEAELAAVLRHCHDHSLPLTIAGAQTGLSGGSVPLTGALVSLRGLNQILAVNYSAEAEEWRVLAQAGVSLRELNEFIQFRQHSGQAVTDAATDAGFLQFKSDPARYFYPPDPTETSASLGGSVATNASGARTFRYGPTRAWVRSLRVFLANGDYLDIPRGKYFASPAGKFTVWTTDDQPHTIQITSLAWPATKNAAGIFTAPLMDLIDLFIGSEGTLGIITRVEVALLVQQERLAMLQILNSDLQAVALTEKMRAETRLPLESLEFYSATAVELIRTLRTRPNYPSDLPPIPENAQSALFFELEYNPDNADSLLETIENGVSSVGADLADSWAASDRHELDNFKTLRHLVPETINGIIAERKQQHPGLHKLGTDLAVPDAHLSEIWQLYQTECTRLGFEWYAFGHIGNNHIHVNILPRDEQELQSGLDLFEKFARRAVELGGTVSAEHGIGKLKRKFLEIMIPPAEMAQMQAIKLALDPHAILNAGVLFPD